MTNQQDTTSENGNSSSISEKSSQNSESAIASAKAAAKSTLKSGGPERVWADLHDNLTNALNTWEHLSVESEQKLSPEQEQMNEVKRLLNELKNKLREFSK